MLENRTYFSDEWLNLPITIAYFDQLDVVVITN